ncbi:MAG: DUF6455 family protein, partial [Ferrovibrio sp.]
MSDQQTQPARSLATRLIDGVKDCFGRAGSAYEWRGLDDGERRRIAQDMAMSGSDLSAFIAGSGGSAELAELLGRTGLQQTAAVYGALHDMQRVCGFCQQRSDCRDWLSIPAEARDETAMPPFCPNKPELEVL